MSLAELLNISYQVKYYNDKRLLFDDFNLEIHEGAITLVMGPSGSGKTTLLSILGTLIKPDKGSVNLFGDKVTKKNLFKIRRKIGFVFQTPIFLENETVKENLLFYGYLNCLERKIILEKGYKLLKEFGLDQYIEQKPVFMSGGERQRLALILPMIKESSLILADEPLGSIDPKNKEMVKDTLVRLNKKGYTLVIASHDHSLKNICTQLVEL
ncbi:MAG: ABC transporter ATP-binding protein [Candidatus Heimdallarchaeaceae archaeon]